MAQKALRICIVGSGPSGFYTASRLLKNRALNVQVDILERLPVPYGLIRYGIAPDHAEVKSVTHQFNQLATDEGAAGTKRIEFIGNVHLRTNDSSIGGIQLKDLQERYHSVILAYGSQTDRLLGIHGEHEAKHGLVPAREFVAWYNGYPGTQQSAWQQQKKSAMARMLRDSGDTAVVIGQGNVALDVARVLLTPNAKQSLGKTDMPQYAVDALAASSIRHVQVVGRRGPVHVSFSAKELRELLAMSDATEIDLQVPAEDCNVPQQRYKSADVLALDRPRKRVVGIMEKIAASKMRGVGRQLSLRFFKQPVEIMLDADKAVAGVKFATTLYKDDGSGRVVPTEQSQVINTRLVFRSIGYKSVGVPGLPFNDTTGTVPHLQGRVMLNDDQVMPGVYVSGWLKTGPVGVIASTMYDAYQTADCLLQDIEAGVYGDNKPSRTETLQWLHERMQSPDYAPGTRNNRPVTFSDWKRIEREEVRRGQALGKPYEKLTDTQEILDLLAS